MSKRVWAFMSPAPGPALDFIQARWLRTFLTYQNHVGRHRYRFMANAPHPITGKPSFVGCEKCGKPRP